MSLSVHALASGSSANSTLIQYQEAGCVSSLLVDAGLTMRGMESALRQYGVRPDSLQGIMLTHEHVDHCRAAHGLSRKYGVPLMANERTLSAVTNGKPDTPHTIVPTGSRLQAGPLVVETFPVPHDAIDPVGINIYAGEHKVSQITDAGCITPEMRRAVRSASLLILEANHDVYRLKAGPYPAMLKRRILSDRGHLSNEAAVGLLVDHLLDHGPCSIWLAHLSKTNNMPKLAASYARARLSIETRCPFALEVAHRDHPSISWTPGERPVQLRLFQ